MESLTVCAVVPVLNEASAIEPTLHAIAAQEINPHVVVVDGGSADDTVTIARRYARVVNGPTGRAKQMNTGAAETQADVLVFVHADTILPVGAIKSIKKSLDDPAVVGGRFKIRLDRAEWQYRMVASAINLRDSLVKGFTGDQAIFVRRSVFEAMGGYRDIALMEDLDFGRRMGRCGKVVRLPIHVVTSARRWTRNGVVRTVLLMWLLKVLYALRCPPDQLKRLYGDAR